jgi:hypothetical protein
MNDDLFVDLNSLRPLLSALNPAVPIPPLSATVLENDPYRVGLNARWTVYAGGRISGRQSWRRGPGERSRAGASRDR